MASIHSDEEQDFIRQTFSPSYVWIGAVDTDNNSVWEWTDGSTFNFSNWMPGQPDGGEQYAYIDFSTNAHGEWVDYVYSYSFNYICQLTF